MKVTDLIANEELRRKVDNISESDIVVVDDLGQIPQNESFHTETYVILLCLQGRATFQIESKSMEVRKNDLVMCHPQQLLSNVMTSLDFRGQGLLVSPNFLESVFLLTGRFWEASFIVKTSPIIHLNDEEAAQAMFNNNIIREKLKTRTPHHKEMMQLLLRALVYDFYDIVAPKMQINEYGYTSAESIFGRFMRLAGEETPRHREVRYYADRLCITPKYLSAVCKQASGKTASVLLNELAIDKIKTSLKATDKTVKQIASEAGFENLSFFGKYVRRETGLSPRAYRTEKD